MQGIPDEQALARFVQRPAGPIRITRMSRFKRLTPYFLIGPVSGPLLAGVVHNLRGGGRYWASCTPSPWQNTPFCCPPS